MYNEPDPKARRAIELKAGLGLCAEKALLWLDIQFNNETHTKKNKSNSTIVLGCD